MISVDVSAAHWNASIHNGGVIDAGNGLVLLKTDVAVEFLSQVVSTSQTSIASEAVVDNGFIRLVTNTGEIAGRSIYLDAGGQGQTVVSGILDASSPTSAGGRIDVIGGNVLVERTSRITADGKTGGGEVYIGGGWQGQNPNIRQAQITTVEPGADISASAIGNGDGGTVVIWSDIHNPDSVTSVNGTIKAEGRGAGKQGGRVETSGYRVMIGEQAFISTLTEQGVNGRWLIDPNDYTVAASGGDITGSALSIALDSNNVTILSSSGGTAGSGDINILDAVTWQNNNLELIADRDIKIHAVVTAKNNASLTMTANNNTSDDGNPYDPVNTPVQTRAALISVGRVRVGLHPNDSRFAGQVDFDSRSGSGFLTINGESYTVINSLTGTAAVNLDEIVSSDTSVRYALGSDIDASSLITYIASDFRGIFDGLGHTVDGMSISTTLHHGLFNKLSNGSVVRNLGVTNGSVISNYASVGLLAGTVSGAVIHNTFTTGYVRGSSVHDKKVSWQRSKAAMKGCEKRAIGSSHGHCQLTLPAD